MVEHDTILSGATLKGRTSGPLVLRRTDREFIPAILSGLKTDDGRAQVAQTVAATRDAKNVLRLFQPVHQVFHVALLQASCQTFGSPRLDPARIDSSGLVIRRISADDPKLLERWSKAGDKIAGWVPCADDDVDPDPARRPPRVTSGNARIDAMLMMPTPAYNGFSEDVAPLFVAPPDACVAAKATLLYGLVPVTSTEKSEAALAPTYDNAMVRDHMPYFLRTDASRTIPRASDTLSATDADDPSLLPVISVLKQLQFEFDAFGSSTNGVAIFNALNTLDALDADGHQLADLGDFLKSAASILVDGAGGTIRMPARWPDISDATSAAIAALIQRALEARLASVMSGEGRYEDATRVYRMRAFIRVKQPDGCPPVLVWSDYSEPFAIASWYESSGLPPIKIQLPKIDAGFLKSLKPNVSFVMPESLFNTLQKDSKKTLKGEDSSGGGSSLGVMWICSFSLPLITICAFFVLNIFLSLFDIFFQWMLFIKICLPIPVPKGKNG